MTSRPSTAAPILAALALLLLPLGAYVGGYYGLGIYVDFGLPGGTEEICRFYRHRWLSSLYQPAGELEAYLRGLNIQVGWLPSEEVPLFMDYSNRHP